MDQMLDGASIFAIFASMAASGKRSVRGRSSSKARASDLGNVLGDLRRSKRLSLRQVEEATGRAISNAYLSQLENGKIRRPSPDVLHALAGIYAVPYESLMERAGYLMLAEGKPGGGRRRLDAFAIDDLTAEEEEELLKYLAFIRSRNPGTRA